MHHVNVDVCSPVHVETGILHLRPLTPEIFLERLEIVLIHVLEELSENYEVCLVVCPPVVKESFVHRHKHQLKEAVEQFGHYLWSGLDPFEEKLLGALGTLDQVVQYIDSSHELLISPETCLHVPFSDVNGHVLELVAEELNQSHVVA